MAKDLKKALATDSKQMQKAEEALLALQAKNSKAATTNKFAIAAKEARRIADTTNCMLNHIYKAISECAKEGVTLLDWSIYNISPTLVNDAVTELKAAGYAVATTTVEDEEGNEKLSGLIIKW